MRRFDCRFDLSEMRTAVFWCDLRRLRVAREMSAEHPAAQPRDDSFAGETTREDKTPHLRAKYRTIVADPPWDVGRGPDWGSGGTSRPLPYPTMNVEEIAALPVSKLAEKRSHLYLWTINAYIEDTYEIARHWGFRPVVLLTWAKDPHGIGLGGTFVQTTEHVLFARRGILKAAERVDSTWWLWKRGEHSAKPEAFLDLVERVSPAPRLEMFSRRARLGWDTWGNESLHGMEAVA